MTIAQKATRLCSNGLAMAVRALIGALLCCVSGVFFRLPGEGAVKVVRCGKCVDGTWFIVHRCHGKPIELTMEECYGGPELRAEKWA